MNVSRGVVDAWERFWFAQIPTGAYTRLRIAFGVVGLTSLFGLMPVSTYWTASGLFAPAPNLVWFRQLLSHYGLDAVVGWSLFLTLLSAFSLMIVGRWCRAAVALGFLGSAVLSRWNPLPLFGAHAALMSFLFPLMWIDTGGHSRQSRLTDQPLSGVAAIWPLRLLRFQICVIYVSSGLWKLLSETWRDGSALHYVLNRNVFPRFPAYGGSAIEPVLTIATYSTLVWELTFPLCMLNRWTRRIALAIGVGVHLGMWASLEVGPFSFVMLASYLAFIDPLAVQGRVARLVDTARSAVIVRTGV